MQQYLDAPTVEADDDFNILAWWKSYEVKYPVLSIMARDILTYPVSTVASESAFSTGGRILDDYRSCLDPRTVEALVCLQDWYYAQDREQDNSQYLPPIEDIEIVED